MEQALVISNNNELLRLMPPDIVFISAERNYSHIITSDGDERLVVVQIGQLELMIANQLRESALNFIRIGRSLIINRTYIYFISVSKLQLVLKSPNGKQHILSVPHDPLVQIKKIVEESIKKESTS